MEKDYSIAGKLRPNIHIADIGREGIGLQGLCGSDNIKRGNLAFIDEDTVIFVTGNAVIFQNIYSDERKYLMGIDEGGVGCIAVHPSRFDALQMTLIIVVFAFDIFRSNHDYGLI